MILFKLDKVLDNLTLSEAAQFVNPMNVRKVICHTDGYKDAMTLYRAIERNGSNIDDLIYSICGEVHSVKYLSKGRVEVLAQMYA